MGICHKNVSQQINFPIDFILGIFGLQMSSAKMRKFAMAKVFEIIPKNSINSINFI